MNPLASLFGAKEEVAPKEDIFSKLAKLKDIEIPPTAKEKAQIASMEKREKSRTRQLDLQEKKQKDTMDFNSEKLLQMLNAAEERNALKEAELGMKYPPGLMNQEIKKADISNNILLEQLANMKREQAPQIDLNAILKALSFMQPRGNASMPSRTSGRAIPNVKSAHRIGR